MEPGHLGCRRRARSRRAAGRKGRRHKQTGDQRWPRRSRSQHSTQNTRRGNWKTPRDGGPPPPTATEHKQETAHIETCGHRARRGRVLIRTVSVSGPRQYRGNRCEVCLDRPCTADIVGSQYTACRQRDGLQGQRERRSPDRRTCTETAQCAQGLLRPDHGADRSGVVVDPIGSAAKAHPRRRGIAAKSRKRRLRRGQRKDRTMSKKARRNSGVCWFRGSAIPSPAPPIDAR